MTDRELLEKAARAANDAGAYIQIMSGLIFEAYDHGQADGVSSPDWNPLQDDGDAFRLAVIVGMTVCTDGAATVSAVLERAGGKIQTVNVDGDSAAATRRAIVRAAAALGDAQ